MERNLSFKRLVSLTVAIVLIVSMIAGCGTKSTADKNDASSTNGKTEDTKPKQTYTLSIFTNRITPNPDSDVMKKLQEKLGQKLEVTSTSDQEYQQKLNVLMASDQMPDIFGSDGNDLILKKGTAGFTEDELKKYMPKTYANILDGYSKAGVDKTKTFSQWMVNGKLHGINGVDPYSSIPSIIVIRMDKLEELGKKIPTTIDELEDVCKAYKAKYPDKYPLNARGKDQMRQSFYYVLSAYGVSFDWWRVIDNKLLMGPWIPQMKDALTTLQKWYKAGYINPEWFTEDNNALINDFVKGNGILVPFRSIGEKVDLPYATGSIWEQAAAKDPNVKVGFMPYLKGPNGTKPVVIGNVPVSNKPLCFGRQLEKDADKLHTAMNVVDSLYNDKEIFFLRSNGIEGKHYDIVNGHLVMKKELNTYDAFAKEGIQWGIFSGMRPPKEFTDIQMSEDYVKNIDKYCTGPNGIYSKDNVKFEPNWVSGTVTNAAGESLDAKGKSKMDQWNSVFTEVIIGRKSIADFEKFIDDWKKEVGNEIIEAATKQYMPQ